MLNTGSSQGSAKIYQFPTGGRAALGGRAYGDARANVASAPRVNEVVCDSWYHQAAIDESQQGRDH